MAAAKRETKTQKTLRRLLNDVHATREMVGNLCDVVPERMSGDMAMCLLGAIDHMLLEALRTARGES